MPISVTNIDNGGVLLKGEGVVSGTDIKQANEIIYSPEKIQKIQYQLWDYTNVSKFNVSNEEVIILAQQDIEAAEINPKMFVAAVGKEDLVYGLIRMWEAHVDFSSIETMAFRIIEDAEKWIAEKIQKP